MLEERKFLKKKLETFFKSQHFIDDQVFTMAQAAAKKDAEKQKEAPKPVPQTNGTTVNHSGYSSSVNSLQ